MDYLDHQIFVRTGIAREIAWFPPIEIFEDAEISYRLLKYGKPDILSSKIITSARRFTKNWIFKQALINQILKLMFHLWIWDKFMNKFYEKKDWFNVKYK